jgi:MFS family permease
VWIYAVGMLGFTSMTAVLALYLRAEFGFTEKTIGLVFMFTGGLSVVMRAIVLGWMIDRFGESGVMRIGGALLALGLLLIPLPRVLPLFIPALGLVPIGTALLFPATTALLTHQAPDTERGQVLGVQQTFGGVARVLAPIGATAAFQALGVGVPFYLAAAVVSLAATLAWQVEREPAAVLQRR